MVLYGLYYHACSIVRRKKSASPKPAKMAVENADATNWPTSTWGSDGDANIASAVIQVHQTNFGACYWIMTKKFEVCMCVDINVVETRNDEPLPSFIPLSTMTIEQRYSKYEKYRLALKSKKIVSRITN